MSTKVKRNVFSLVFSRLFAALLVLAGYIYITRYLGNVGFGKFQFVLSYVMLFAVIVDFGLEELVIKYVSEKKEDAERYFGYFFAIELYLATLFYALLLAIAYMRHLDPVVFAAISVTGFGMFLNALNNPYTAIVSAYEDMHLIAVVNFADSVINVVIMFLAVLLHRGIVFLALVQVLMGIAHFIIYSRVIRRYIPHLQIWRYLKELNWDIIKRMLKAALPFGTLVGFSIIYNRIDVIILSALRGYGETGLYASAYKFVDFLAFFPAVVSSSLYPYFSSQIFQGNIVEARIMLEKYTKYMLGIALPVAFGGALVAPKLIVAFAGPEYYPAFAALQILVFASAIMVIYAAINSMMISQLARYAMWISFGNIFINTIGNLLLIPRYGFRAAAVMTLVSEFIQAGLYFYFVRKKITHFAFFKNAWKPFIAALIMAACLFPIRSHSLMLTLPAGAVIYAVVILLTRFVSLAELKSLLPEKFNAARI